VLIGINLLREGLDIPEVSLVAILDADKEGYLRSERSLIQTIGRAARNINGTVIMYGDRVTESMRRAIYETARRRRIQSAYNDQHDITPQSVRKAITSPLVKIYESDYVDVPLVAEEQQEYLSAQELAERIEQTKKEMKQAAAALEFEQAATLRDRLQALEQRALGVKSDSGIAVPLPPKPKPEAPTGGRSVRGSVGRTGGKAAARGRAARWQR
jgi:excinuclease ABC subunit B